ncbi:MAG: FkbM family methyltransferase [Nannocystaceae bacterium]|nr:FkbM family methyltransferase [Nannocystaceae bacterium]
MADALDKQVAWYRTEIDFTGSVFVDGGANEGALLHALWDAVGGGFEVHAVEPLEENISKLRARMPQSAAWNVHPVVLTDRDEPRSVRVESDGLSGHNCVVRSSGKGREVPGRRLSTLVPHATVIKLDVEGHEYTILDEALDTMPGVQAWAVEFHRSQGRPLQAALGALARRGYSLRAAGRRADDPSGPWIGADIPASLHWGQIPVARRNPDGSIFKMVHIIARRTAGPVG